MERRVGVFGGTFDPPHVGHVAVAADARDQLRLDIVLFVVANDPWQKSGERAITPADVRLAMVHAALEGSDGLLADDRELLRGGPSYSLDTVRELLAAGADEVHLLLGRDAAAAIETWHQPELLRTMCTPVVLSRPGETGALPDAWPWREVTVPHLEVSSSDLRRRVREGRTIDGQVPPAVKAVIEAHRLYRDAP